jgi:hypothetical protein
MAGAACFAAGLISFELISYHLARTGAATGFWIPLFLAISTGVGVVPNLALGQPYDRFGIPVVLVAVLLSASLSPFVILGGFYVALAGLILWGVGYATQDTLLKAVVAGLLPEGRRSLAFGLFYTGYGFGWLVGSVATGLLYEYSMPLLIGFAIAVQIISLPLSVVAENARKREAQS